MRYGHAPHSAASVAALALSARVLATHAALPAAANLAGAAVTNGTAAAASTPLARALAADHVVPADAEKLFEPRARIAIADGGELNWPIYVSDNFVVADARLAIRGLYHDDARDVTVDLLHEDNSVRIVDPALVSLDNRRANCWFGTPASE